MLKSIFSLFLIAVLAVAVWAGIWVSLDLHSSIIANIGWDAWTIAGVIFWFCVIELGILTCLSGILAVPMMAVFDS